MNDAAAVIVTTPTELRLLIRDAVREEMAKLDGTGFDPVLTRLEAAAILKCHPDVVTKRAKSGGLPGFKMGREWRFRRSEIEAWMMGEK